MTKTFKNNIKHIISLVIYIYYKLIYKRPIRPFKLIWVDTDDIRYSITEQLFPNGSPKDRELMIKHLGTLILDSTIWDHKITADEHRKNSCKYQSIKEHFIDKVPWIESAMFTERFYNNLKKHGQIEGYTTLEELASYYDKHYDKLFENIKINGLIPATKKNNIRSMYVDIDKEGNYCYTGDGNHRLAMALILNIKKIPVQVRAIHKDWQLLRDELWVNGADTFFQKYPHLKKHEDLKDCLK